MKKVLMIPASFAKGREILEKVSFLALTAIAVSLCLSILSTERNMSKLRKEQLQHERVLSKLAYFQSMQRLTELSARDRKLFDTFVEGLEKNANAKISPKEIGNYHEYLNGRGEMSSFSSIMEEVFVGVEQYKKALDTIPADLKGSNVIIALSDVKSYFAKMQRAKKDLSKASIGHEQYLASEAFLANLNSILKILVNEKALEKSVKDLKRNFITPLDELSDLANALKNKNSFVLNGMPAVFAMSKTLANAETQLNDSISIYSAYLRLGHEHITHISMMFALASFALFGLGFGRTFSRKKTEINAASAVKENVKTVVSEAMPIAMELKNNEVSNFLSSFQTTASAVTDIDENIVWASKSFYETMGLDPEQKYNWNELLESHLIRSNSALSIEGAVTIASQPKRDFRLVSKTPNSGQRGVENRIIELVPIYNYQVEMEKTMQRLAPFTEIPGVEIYEVGETISEVASEISFLFQTADIMFKVESEKSVFIGFDKTVMRKNLKTLLTGVIIYMYQAKAKRLTAAFKKIGDSFSMTFSISGQKFKEVNAPLNFRDKTYPSLSAYLEQVEEGLSKYGAEVNLKNVHTNNEDNAIITWSIQETDDALFNMETLEKKRRVHRVVKAAEKIKHAPATPERAGQAAKKAKSATPLNLRPKDFQ